MFNLLPEQEKKKVHKQYVMRKTVVILAFSLVMVMSASIFLLPSYILVTYKNQDIEAQIDGIKVAAEKKNRPELSKRLADINAKIASIHLPENEYAYYDLVERVIDVKPAGVSIASLSMQRIVDKDKKEIIRVQVVGVANTRNQLVAFLDNLKQNETYSNVVLPVESLANEFNADFSISFEINI